MGDSSPRFEFFIYVMMPRPHLTREQYLQLAELTSKIPLREALNQMELIDEDGMLKVMIGPDLFITDTQASALLYRIHFSLRDKAGKYHRVYPRLFINKPWKTTTGFKVMPTDSDTYDFLDAYTGEHWVSV